MNNGYAICQNEWIRDMRISNDELRILIWVKNYGLTPKDELTKILQINESILTSGLENLRKLGYIK